MPLLPFSTYSPPPLLGNPHVQTIVPTLFRRVRAAFRRVRHELPDGDFLDVDELRGGNPRAALLLHGLESHSRQHYMAAMARVLARRGWDVFAMNFRGCSGEPNRLYSAYHSGKSDDVLWLLNRISGGYDCMALVGFSVGGNIALKLAGEQGGAFIGSVAAVAAVCAPCDLAGSARQLERSRNRLYMQRFAASLRKKIMEKHRRFGSVVTERDFAAMTTFTAIDNLYTAPAHGFADAEEYWQLNSSAAVIGDIAVPALLISAADDPFLSPECYPRDIARKRPHVTLEIPPHGGHLGFVTFGREFWHERRIAGFLEEHSGDPTTFSAVE